MRVILTALAVPGFALGLATAAGTLMKDEVPVYDQPTSVVWADRVYSNKHDLAMWLSSRGARYRVWAARHPAMAEVLEPGRVQKLTRPTTPARRLAGDSLGSADSRQSTLAIGVVLASALGLLTLLVALRVRIPVLAVARKLGGAPRKIRRAPLGRGRSARAHLPMPRATHARATLSKLAATTAAATRGGWARIEQSVPARGDATEDYQAMYAREEVRRHVADLAVYVTSVLLACVVGACVALYLN